MSTTTHRIMAERSTGADTSAEYEIAFSYRPAGPLHFYKRNGDPADPPDPEEIDYLSVRPAPWPAARHRPIDAAVERWARDWLDDHQDEAREAALADREADADDAADYRRIEEEAFIR